MIEIIIIAIVMIIITTYKVSSLRKTLDFSKFNGNKV